MTLLLRKTPKGSAEVETRANRLTPRLRTALILVDGRRTLAELRSLAGAEADASLQFLLDGGYIEAQQLATAAGAAPLPSIPPATASAAAMTQPPAMSADAFAELRRSSVRALNDLLGPTAESLAIKMERARTPAELGPLLQAAVQLIGNVRGSAAAAGFRSRFLGS